MSAGYEGSQFRPWWVWYALPLALVALATWLRLELDSLLVWKAPFVFFILILAILTSARFGGTVPGFIATGLSVVGGDFFFVQPRYTFRVTDAAEILNLALFSIVGISISILSGQLRNALGRSVEEEQRWTAGPDGIFGFINARWYEFNGGDPCELPTTSRVNHIHPEDLPGMAENRPHWFETRVEPALSSPAFVPMTAAPRLLSVRETNMSKKILRVENNLSDIELTIRTFEKHRIADEVAVAEDGQEAIDYLSSAGQWEGRDLFDLPALTLLDLKLPRVSDDDVLRHIRSEPRTVRKPVDLTQFPTTTEQLGLCWLRLNETAPPARD